MGDDGLLTMMVAVLQKRVANILNAVGFHGG